MSFPFRDTAVLESVDALPIQADFVVLERSLQKTKGSQPVHFLKIWWEVVYEG